MQGGAFGSLCFLAFLLSGITGQNLINSEDLKYGGQSEIFDDLSDSYALDSQGYPGLTNSIGSSEIRTSQFSDLDYNELSPEEKSAYSSARSTANSAGGLIPGLGYGSAGGYLGANSYLHAYGPQFGHSSASADAIAQAIAGGNVGSSQAEAMANTQAYDNNIYNPNAESSYAQSQALANAINNGQSFGYLPYSLNGLGYPNISPGYSQADAEAALAQAQSGGYGGLSQAEANAIAQAQGASNFGQGYSSPEALAQALAQVQSQPALNIGYPSSGLSSNEASALAQALASGGNGFVPGSGNNFANALAQAQSQGQAQVQSQSSAIVQSQGNGEAQSQAHSQVQTQGPYGVSSAQSQAQAHVSGQGQAFGHAHSQALDAQGSIFANALAGAKTRVIPPNEYVLPYDIPGAENILICSREGELHNFWSPIYECLVCACINQYGYLRPVCASCAGCMVQPYEPEPLPAPMPMPQPPLPPMPVPESQVSCDPLPTETPFENPLNPCQICVCHLTLDGYGRPDVQIVCQESPACRLRPQPMPLHPLPEPSPIPLPLPLPEPMPGPMPGPMPEPMPIPLPEPVPLPEPLPLPIPDYPVPMPIIPPAPVQPTPPPGPLPGPPPHKSCRPYLPNQPFAHPWDECQECVCSELYAPGIINIEVMCYTKSECCIVPPPQPYPLLPPSSPVLPQPIPNQQLQILDLVCEYRGVGSVFMHPKNPCRICTCEVFGNLVAPVCKLADRPECAAQPDPYANVVYIEPRCRYKLPLQPFVTDCSVCTCQPIFNYVIATCNRQPNCGADSPPLISGGSFSSANAYANAVSNGLLSKPYQYPFSSLLGNSQSSAEASALANNNWQGNLYSPGNSYASSETVAQAQSNSMGGSSSAIADAEANSNSGYGQYLPYSSPGSSSSASADAQAYSSGLGPYVYEPHSQPGLSYLPPLPSSLSEANPGYDSILPGQMSNLGIIYQPGSTLSELGNAMSNLRLNPLRLQTLPNLSPVLGSVGSEPMANFNSGYNPYLSQLNSNLGPSNLQGLAYSSAEAEANSGLNQFGGSSSSALSEANAVSNSINPFLYRPNSNIGSPSGFSSGYLPGSSASALAEAQALSDANLGLNTYGPYSNLNPSYNGGSSAVAESLPNVNTGYYPSAGTGSSGSSASASAESEAISGVNPGLYSSPYTSYPNLQPYQPEYSMGAAEAQALANANSGYNQFIPNVYNGYNGADSSASALAEAASNSGYGSILLGPYSDAEAMANANTGYGSYLSPYSSGSSSSAQAEAIANSNSGYSQPIIYPGSLISSLPSNSYTSANAMSEASSNVNSSPYNNLPYGNLYLNSPVSGSSSASAEAEALANSGLAGQLSPYQQGLGSTSQAQAQAIANSAGYGHANAQSQAQALAQSGRPLIRSGRGLCKYVGDKYHHNCQACYCTTDYEGNLSAACLGTPCA